MSAKRKILFIDRDGTLIEEPADYQVDRLDKVRLVPRVIPCLLQLSAAGYELVMVSNQDGLGTDSFPQADFQGPHDLMMQILESQGIHFSAVHIDPHFEHQQAPTRKPGIGMVLDYLKSGELDLQRSAVIGDRDTDLQLAENMGIRGYKLDSSLDWPAICSDLLSGGRRAEVSRTTNETRIQVEVDLDAAGPQKIHTGLGIFDHFVEQLALHGGFALTLQATGDLHIDEHHTVEDCALALGTALDQALGDRRGIGRYGFLLPMDEALTQTAVDLSGRPYYVQHGELPRASVGDLNSEMIKHFFHSLAQNLRAAIHIEVKGENTHHMAEAMFKSVGRCLRQACTRQGQDLPSSKGLL
ncbi:MAG: bifunctional histidinol-phosphatase/imidazoleglycerol-phosphate dehydratase HisB [Wenzhouxiangellaceae bacterium]